MSIERNFELSSDKANESEKEWDFREILWRQCNCAGSSQIPSQDDPNYHQFLSLYRVRESNNRTELHIYDTENKKEEVKILNTKLMLDESTCITQLPNGELFCYGNLNSGITLIIDRSYGVRMLLPGTCCHWSSALYFNSNIYCFGGDYHGAIALSKKFDLEKSRWVNLTSLPKASDRCHSVIFNGNILISGYYSRNLWLYSIEIDSFSIITFEFARNERKFLINVEKLYLIELDYIGLIYESEDEYHWKPLKYTRTALFTAKQIYCLCNKEKIYISARDRYYEFDLKAKAFLEPEV